MVKKPCFHFHEEAVPLFLAHICEPAPFRGMLIIVLPLLLQKFVVEIFP